MPKKMDRRWMGMATEHTGGAQRKLVVIGGDIYCGRERLVGNAQVIAHAHISRHKRRKAQARFGS